MKKSKKKMEFVYPTIDVFSISRDDVVLTSLVKKEGLQWGGMADEVL